MKITIRGYLKKNKLSISIAILVLFHITAIIGVSLGYKEWFVSKTPLTLSLSFVLLVVNYPLNSFKKWAYAGVFFFGGMMIEWIGLHQGWPFGNYVYGENLGAKFDGVPYFIGVFWAVLTLVTGDIASKISDNLLIKIFLGAFLMVLLDYFMETAAPQFDFWTFEGGMAPVKNYIAWFAVAAFLHLILQKVKLKGNFSFSLALYLIQLIFFSYFYVLYSI
jgi:bisanhydrobacterioruberin hydratase